MRVAKVGRADSHRRASQQLVGFEARGGMVALLASQRAHTHIAAEWVAMLLALVIAHVQHTFGTLWPSGLRRWLKAPVRKGVGSNSTGVMHVAD